MAIQWSSTSVTGGRVISIYVASTTAEPMQPRKQVRAVPQRGLDGDRYFDRAGNASSPGRARRERAEVTLIEAEVIDHLQRELGIDVEAVDSRRNIVTRGLPLNDLVGNEFRIGEVRLPGTGLCEPCVSLVKTRENRHLLRGLVRKGGLCARILSPGTIAVGDAVVKAAAAER